jgi:5-methylcytosine-specific restriction endonuclease McrA
MADADFKLCSKCGESKDRSLFGKQAIRKDGLNPWCKACKSTSAADYYERNKERLKPIRAAWIEANPEKMLAYVREHQARWRASDPGGYKAYMAKYRTPEVSRRYAREDYRRHRLTRLAANAAWRVKNADHVRATSSIWKGANKERLSALKRSYKARKRGAEGSHTGSDIQKLYALQRGKCVCCAVSLKSGYHVDHVMPLSLGGSNWPSNLQLLCPRCNLRKSAKHPSDFAHEIGRLF